MSTQRGVVWPYLLLSVALLGALSFGWYQTRQKNQLALDAENKYMSSFHKLKWTSENMEERTAKLMATNDTRLQQSLLADLRVSSAQAVEEMSVLPFATLNTTGIESYLNTLQNRADELHDKLAQGGSLTTADWSQMADLRRQSVTFERELSSLLGLVGTNHIRWADTVRVTSPAQSGSAATPITQSVVQMEKALTPPPGATQTPGPTPGESLPAPKMSPGARVDATTAVKAIKAFVDLPLQGEPTFTGSSDPADKGRAFSLYFFSAKKANGTPLDFGVSIHGGHVIYMIDGRPVRDKRFTVSQLADKAAQMLRRWGYPEGRLISTAENDGTLILDFAPLETGVAVEPETIKVMLAMDNAELVGFDARNYWINRHPRTMGAPALSETDARQRVSPRLQLEASPALSLVVDRRRQERLVWAVRGRVDDQRFRVFIDARTGQEVDIQRIAGDPAPPMNEPRAGTGA
ncbi:MAG TPA: PepSY1/2 domain-containing protein [Symbiobacteriaceae bacterium]|jgi:spore germination protein